MPVATEPVVSAFFTRHTLASRLQRSIPTLDRDKALGRIPEPIRLGGSLRWPRKEIEAWIEAGCPARAEWEAMKRAAKR